MESERMANGSDESSKAESNNNNNKNDAIARRPGLEELSRRLHRPITPLLSWGAGDKNDDDNDENVDDENVDTLYSPERSLSHIPWKLQLIFPGDSRNLQDNSKNNNSSSFFPSFSYLDLRRQQNMAWANERWKEGNEISLVDPQKAESLFQQGLDLIPNHVELLVAHAKVLIIRRGAGSVQSNRRQKALSNLQTALQIEPDHVVAKTLLHRLQREEQQQQRSALLSFEKKKAPNQQAFALKSTGNTAYQDALMERNLALEDSNLDDAMVSSTKDEEKDKNHHGEAEESKGKKSKKKKSKKKKRSKNSKKSKHRRKHKRRRHRHRKNTRHDDSSSSDDEDSSLETSATSSSVSTSSSSDRSRRKKRRRRRHDSSSEDDNDDDKIDNSGDEKRSRKRQRHHTSASNTNGSEKESLDNKSGEEGSYRKERKHRDRRPKHHKRRKHKRKRRHHRRDESPSSSSSSSHQTRPKKKHGNLQDSDCQVEHEQEHQRHDETNAMEPMLKNEPNN